MKNEELRIKNEECPSFINSKFLVLYSSFVRDKTRTMYLPADEFDYVTLLGLGREGPAQGMHAARVALLGFCTTKYLAQVLRGVGRAAGFPILTYESEYNTVEQTLLDPGSEFYAFKPDFVVFVTAVQAVRDRLLGVDVSQRTPRARKCAGRRAGQARRHETPPGPGAS